MGPPKAALVIIGAGLVTFSVVFTFLEFSPSVAAPSQTPPAPEPTSTPAPAFATDSLAPKVQDGQLAIGLPTGGSEALLHDVQPGDRLDIFASLTSSESAQPVTAVVVRGATVLRPPTSTDPLLIAAPSADVLVLAHLVLGGTRLGYVVWPSNVASHLSEAQPVDEQTARSLLGLAITPTVSPTISPTSPPVVTPPPRAVSGFLYQVQSADSWNSVAATFGLSVQQLREWNEATADEDPVPGRLVFIPRPS